MSAVHVQRLAAFSDDPAGGNPAGVVVTDEALPEALMQDLAAEVGYSETAFLVPQGAPGRYAVRYFSPAAEVPFCGHATIAAGVALAEADADLDRLALDTPGGPVTVDLARDPVTTATLTSPPATTAPVGAATLDAALATFGWSRAVLDPALPPGVASAGAAHLVLPVADRATLRGMAYDFDALGGLCRAEGWTTVHVVWREAADRFAARDPFPAGGVVEDPATGAAAAAFGGHLRAHGLLPAGGAFTIVQGEDLGRRSVLAVAVPPGDGGVRVRGTAVRLPEPA